MKFGMGPAPARKRKQVTNELDRHDEYLQLKAVLMHGRLKPHETAYILMGPDDAKALGYKWPWRSATDSLRRLIRSMGLERDYRVVKYETDTPGTWCIRLSYEPPMSKTQVSGAVQTPAAAKTRGRPRKTAAA